MQIVVGGTSTGSTIPVDDVNATILGQMQAALPVAFKAGEETIIVPQAAYNGVYGTNIVDRVGTNLASIQGTSLTFSPLLPSGALESAPVAFEFQPKSIIEDFQMDYGRMNAILGVEIPHTNNTNQTSVIQNLQDPPTEVIKISDPNLTPIGIASDGTQIWKLTHNGVDTHAVHIHMFTSQIVNRVGWDGAIRPPDPNELGFKDTIRMNPLEDIIVAIRPIKLDLPFKVGNSTRLMAPDAPLGATTGPTGMPLFTGVDPAGNPVTITNQLVNFGWEYVWHCHLLGHEENDMMRPMALAAPPEAPSDLAFTLSGGKPVLTWTDNSLVTSGFTVQRAADLRFTQSLRNTTLGKVLTFRDSSAVNGQNYYYRVIANNTVGSTVPGYSQVTADSAPSNPIATKRVVPVKNSLMVWRPSSGIWYELLGTGYTTTQWGLSTDVVVPGDYDGDGKLDKAVWRPSTGVWYILPSGSPGTYVAQQWGVSTDKPVPGDFDGDRKTDLAVFRPSTGLWYILTSSVNGAYVVSQWGLSTDIPVPGDYDGDGKFDIAVWRPSSGVWYVLRSSAPGTFFTTQWGLSTDIPVPGDYDGDSKADIAVWRPSDGTWYTLLSATPGTYTGRQLGASADIPVPADYDGDGINDIAVFSPSTGNWSVNGSAPFVTRSDTNWGMAGDVPITPITRIVGFFR